MKAFRITYRSHGDDCCPHFTMRVNAHDVAHAEEKFFDSDPADDAWEILKVEHVRAKGGA